MEYKHLCRLTPMGEIKFKEVFYELKDLDKSILKDEEFSEPIKQTSKYRITNYKSLSDMSLPIIESLGGQDKVAAFYDDHGLWKWLTLCLFDQIIESDGKGGKKLKKAPTPSGFGYGESFLFDPAPMHDFKKGMRHKIRGAVIVKSRFPDHKLLLFNPPHKRGQAFESITSNPTLMNNGTLELIDQMWWNDDQGTRKSGHSRDEQGGVVDFVRVMKQLMITYAVEVMTKDELIEILPDYFKNEWLT